MNLAGLRAWNEQLQLEHTDAIAAAAEATTQARLQLLHGLEAVSGATDLAAFRSARGTSLTLSSLLSTLTRTGERVRIVGSTGIVAFPIQFYTLVKQVLTTLIHPKLQ